MRRLFVPNQFCFFERVTFSIASRFVRYPLGTNSWSVFSGFSKLSLGSCTTYCRLANLSLRRLKPASDLQVKANPGLCRWLADTTQKVMRVSKGGAHDCQRDKCQFCLPMVVQAIVAQGKDKEASYRQGRPKRSIPAAVFNPTADSFRRNNLAQCLLAAATARPRTRRSARVRLSPSMAYRFR